MKNYKNPLLAALMPLLFLTATFELLAQEKQTELSDFKIIVEKTGTGIKMTGIAGCTWTDLSFSINNHQPQAIDTFGMTVLDRISENKNENFANFLFAITKTEYGFELKGIEGTAWTKLNFSLAENERQTIDQFGMTNLN